MWRKFINHNLLTNRLLRSNPNLIQQRIARFSNQHQQPSATASQRGDMEDLFLDYRVRYLLKALTGYDPMKIFNTKSMNNLDSPKYRFMTDEQLQMETEQADQRAESMLQMPPVKYPVEHEPKTLEEDPFLQGFLDPSIKLVFMDASAGFSHNERLIVVRESDGTLREATRDERHRTNQIFYPVEECHIDYPKMFEEPHLTDMMNRKAYKLFLDNVCLHFEPEDPRFVQLCHKTYEHIAQNGNFHCLWSTRHYGGMVFHYVFHKQIDPLLFELLSTQQFHDAYNLLRLYYLVNPRDDVSEHLQPLSSSIDTSQGPLTVAKIHKTESSRPIPIDKFIDLLKIYIKNDSNSNFKSRLELLLQKLESEQKNENVVQQ